MITCRDTTTWLFAVEPRELSATTNRDIAAHLACCERCCARVARVAGDTAWLASMTPTASRPSFSTFSARSALTHSVFRRSAVVAAALVAASLLVVVIPHLANAPSRGGTRQARHLAVPSTSVIAPTTQVSEFAPQRTRTSERPSAAAPRSVHQTSLLRLPAAHATVPIALVTAFVTPEPARAVRLDTVLADSASVGIEARPSIAMDVEPLTARRYAVLHSSPTLTVVWFY